jgi:hypothetical protein
MKTVLQVSVPMWLLRLQDFAEDTQDDEAARWAHDAADVVASKGDVLQYGGPDTAGAFNAMSRGLAALATAPGGVRFLGLLWCVEHSPGGRDAESGENVCRYCVSDEEPVNDDAIPLVRARVDLTRNARRLAPMGRYL